MNLDFGALRKSRSQLKSDLKKVKSTFALAAGIRDFLCERITVARAEEEIKKALELREENFLELARTQIYEQPLSPYRRLLRLASCEYSDLRDSVRRYGLERTLERLAKEGVYFTSDEYKGRQEVVRGGESFRVVPADFMRAGARRAIRGRSSGTRGRPVHSISLELDRLGETPFEMALLFSAHNLFACCHAMHEAILPVGGGIKYLLIYARMGVPVDRWFARKIPANSRIEGWYHYLTTYMIVLAAKYYDHGFPKPEFTDIPDLQRIVHWVADKKQEGMECCIKTVASNASRIARVAWENGVSLEGTKFIIGGEPFTGAKRDIIEQVGAKAIPRYSFVGGGNVGLGCVNPIYTDEVHVGEHRLAVISHPQPVAKSSVPIHPLLFTTLSTRFFRFVLNVENGDYAVMENRDCGCALERIGLKLHLHHIRSYEKLTSEGMNYFYGDLFELFEKILPAEFGGGPGDYQLVEEEDGQGQTLLSLVVHPAVEKLDEERLLARLRAAFSQDSRDHRFMTGVWENAGTFRVKRQVPYASPRGKILPLHIPQARNKLRENEALTTDVE